MVKPFSQDVRAALLYLITDGVLDNNPECDCGPDCECGGYVERNDVRYCRYDDSLQGIRMNLFRDPEYAYFYVPVGTYTTERRLVNREFIENYLTGKNIVMVNSFPQMRLVDDTLLSRGPHWEFYDYKTFERLDVIDAKPIWRGYNMVSQWYWLSDEEMLGKPEYIECACWALPKPDEHGLANQVPIEIMSEDHTVIDYLEALLGNIALDEQQRRELMYAQQSLMI